MKRVGSASIGSQDNHATLPWRAAAQEASVAVLP